MTPHARGLAVATIATLLAGCTPDPRTVDPRAPASAVDPRASASAVDPRASASTVEPRASASAVEPRASASAVEPRASASAVEPRASASGPRPPAPSPAPPSDPPAPASGPDDAYLRTAEILSLVPVRGPLRRGTFDATLAAPDGRRAATVTLALLADPNAYRRPLAFAKLARVMGARVVPSTTLRHVAAGDLAAIAGDAGDAVAIVREARVLNDGTVDVLVAARSTSHAGSAWGAPSGKIIDPRDAREMALWDRWASSAKPAGGEDTGLLRDYVEMIALDYLAANDARGSAMVTQGAIVLADNASAFPPHPSTPMLDRALRRLRATERFPKGMLEALRAFDKARSEATFASGGFATWILTPRARVELDERRAALLTLVEAKIAARGERAVLSL